MEELHPEQFTSDHKCKFNFSNGQRYNWMARHGFSHRRTTTKKKKNLSAEYTRALITEFFLNTRVFQLECPKLPETRIFNRDQVPIALSSSYSTTIDDTNNDVIWDSTYDSKDVKRFCSLNLTIPMSVEEDLSNLVRPHLVFKGTKFVMGENWTKKDADGNQEKDLQDKRVDVSFQANAWVDTETNLYGLSKANVVFEKYAQAVQFEDNLSSHKTPAVLAYQRTTNCSQRLYPPDLTQVLQPIDRHIGIQYKTAVYKAIRSKSFELVRESKDSKSPHLSAMEKRILITKAVAEKHELLAKSGAFRRAFIATGTQITNQSAEKEVKLQGLEYDYRAVCSQSEIYRHKSVIEADKAIEEAKRIEAIRIRDETKREFELKFAGALESSKALWLKLEALVIEASSNCFQAIAQQVQGDFICAGSFPAYIIAKQLGVLSSEHNCVQLKFNDIDIYHGNFGDGELKRTDCTQSMIKKIKTEVNLIQCENLNIPYLINNVDINAVAVCVLVQVLESKVISSQQTVAPEFQHFLLEDNTIQSWRTDSPARTLVRMAFKSFEMELPFSMSSLSITDGLLFTSHKRKVEKMKREWSAYPFSEYSLRTKGKKSFVFVRTIANCSCGKKANLKCVGLMCSKCCISNTTVCSVHKKKIKRE